uniref:AlNc14C21G2139 protein n=1 Tax=Albugo laibachii Nc14 TaxID=890382 RepID=F0W5H4_9STRA|nr:AlNc14C21G2139 [Albugo laibachii Nc14]|eukprot:CCA16365.1 AlNc14C21G2139 [Albugo laibachii Nc14]
MIKTRSFYVQSSLAIAGCSSPAHRHGTICITTKALFKLNQPAEISLYDEYTIRSPMCHAPIRIASSI